MFQCSEDAKKAKSSVKLIDGRPVQIIYASRKNIQKSADGGGDGDGGDGGGGGGGEEEVNSEEEDDYESRTSKTTCDKKKPSKSKSERASPKFDIGKVIVIRNLPGSAKEKRILKKCEAFGKVEEIVFPVALEPEVAHISFSSHGAAREAVKELDGTKYKKKLESCMSVSLLSRENKATSKKTLKKSRLIVRNLSFKANSQDVREVFSKYGKVVEIQIPHKEDGKMLG